MQRNQPTKAGSTAFQWLVTVLALLVLALGLTWSLITDHRSIKNTERARLEAQAKVVDTNLRRQLEAAHSALKSVRGDAAPLLSERNGQLLLNQRLQSLSDAMPGVRTMLVLNPLGEALASNRKELVGQNFSQRDYFKTAQASNNPNALYLSKPFKTVLGVFALNLTKVVHDKQGQFAGIVTATLNPEFFYTLLDSVRYSDDVWTTLGHGDGLLIIQAPERKDFPDTDLDSMVAQRTLQAEILGMDKSLVIVIGRSQTAIFANWRQDLYVRSGMFALVSIILAASLFLHQRRQQILHTLALNQEAQRRQAEQALRESALFAREIADNIPGMFAFWKPDLTCAYANKNYEAWFGKTQADMLGISIQSMMGEALYKKNEPYLQAALAGRAQQFERTLTKTDGTTGYTWAQYLPFVMDGEVKGIFALVTDITELKRGQERQRLSELALKTISQSVLITDSNADILFTNDSFTDMTGYSKAEVIGKNCRFLQGPHTDPRVVQRIRDALHRGDRFHGEILNYRKDGTPFWNDLTISAALDEDGNISHFTSVSRDATERRKIDESLRISAAAFESQEGIFVTDIRSVILRINKAFSDMTGYTEAEAIGQTPKLFSSGRHDKSFYDAMWQSIYTHGMWQGEIWNRRKNGEVFPEAITITTVKNEAGEPTHYVANFIDISARKSAEDAIKTLAFFDPLTKLPNRRMLLDRLQQLLASSQRHQRLGALLFVDLDNFKNLNDTRGHHQGDLLLEQVAQRLNACVRVGDTVARLGGDEFVVMLDDLSEDALEAANQAELVGEKILHALNEDYMLTGFRHHCSPSIGITLFGEVLESVDEPLKRADMAMYQAKAAGRNTLRFFDVSIQAALTHRTELESRLGAALAGEQFVLHYQPQVNAAQALTGVEALVRWNDPTRGMVSPAEFIPVAEESGLILPLGQWVLQTACLQIAAWAAQPATAQLMVAVNVSAKQLQQDDFVQQVQKTLKATGANPQRLKLELTESMLLKNVEPVIAKMAELKALGIGFSLDDFGTGYSSLAYLKRLPLDQLKIDQGFVRDILVDANDAAIAKMVIVLAESLGLHVIAEGVEAAAQRDFLAQYGCHGYQGYFFGRPVPLAALEAQFAPVFNDVNPTLRSND